MLTEPLKRLPRNLIILHITGTVRAWTFFRTKPTAEQSLPPQRGTLRQVRNRLFLYDPEYHARRYLRLFDSEPRSTQSSAHFYNAVTDQGAVANAILEQHLQTTLRPRLNRNLPVVDFVKCVYNFTPDRIPLPPTGVPYRLPLSHCRHFCEASSGHDSYMPLQAIFAHLKGQLSLNMNGLPLDSNMFCSRGTEVEMNFKPDFFCSTYSPGSEPWRHHQWSNILAIGQVKRSHKLSDRLRYTDSSINLDIMLNVSMIKICWLVRILNFHV